MVPRIVAKRSKALGVGLTGDKLTIRFLARAAIAGLALLYSGVHFFQTGVISAWVNISGDFLSAWPGYYAAAWNPGIYRGHPGAMPAPLWNYGPVLHMLYLPFTFLSDLSTAYRGILFASYAYILVSFLITYCANLRLPRTIGPLILLIFIWANFFPLYEALLQRNIELVELLLVAFGYAMYMRQRDGLAGAALGAAAMAKFLPGIFFPYFVWKRRWRCVRGFLVVTIPVVLVTQMTLGWEHSFTWMILGGGIGRTHPLNQALSGLFLRTGPLIDPTLNWATVSRFAIIVAGLVCLVLLGKYGRPGSERWEWSLLLIMMVLLLPHANPYYYVFFLLPFSFLAEEASWAHLSRVELVAVAIAFFFIAFPLPLSPLEVLNPARARGWHLTDYLLHLSLPIVGASILAVVVCRRLILQLPEPAT